jgi:hypothetical protein
MKLKKWNKAYFNEIEEGEQSPEIKKKNLKKKVKNEKKKC